MRRNITYLLGLSILVAGAVSLHAATYYASPTGNPANPGTQGSPWPLDYACSHVANGDTIVALSGTYTMGITVGTPNVTVRGLSKWGATLTGAPGHGVSVTADNVTLDGLVIANTGAAGAGVFTTHNGMAVRNCWIHGTGIDGINAKHADDTLVEYNLIEYCGTNPTQDHGMYLSGDSITVRGNVSRYNAAYGIQLYADPSDVSNARVYNNLVYGNCPSLAPLGIACKGANGVANYIFGNTIVCASDHAIWLNATGSTTVGITNNLFSGAGANIVNVGGASVTIQADYNLSPTALSVHVPGNHDVISAAANFVNSANGLYWLVAGSPARGAAASGVCGSVNFFGTAQASVTDIGAFQFATAYASDARTLDPSPVGGANYWQVLGAIYIRTTATGTGLGTDWANALGQWPTSQAGPAYWVGGNTYYVASGNYAGPAWINSATAPGAAQLTIRKATVYDHGTSTGWSDALGTGQAVWGGSLWIKRNNVTVDGQEGAWASDLSGYAQHGFKFAFDAAAIGTLNQGAIVILGENLNPALNVVLAHCELTHLNTVVWPHNGGGGLWGYARQLTNSYCWIHNIAVNPAKLETGAGVDVDWQIDHSVLEQNGQSQRYMNFSPEEHSETLYWYFVNHCTLADSVVRNFGETGGLIIDGPANGLVVRGTQFYIQNPALYSGGGNGAIGATVGTITGPTIYNCTFADIPTQGGGQICAGSHFDASVRMVNNVFYNIPSLHLPDNLGAVVSYNWFWGNTTSYSSQPGYQQGLGNIFVNSAASNYRITSHTNPGGLTNGLVGVDPDGTSRVSPGPWDRGAFEFSGPAPLPAPTLIWSQAGYSTAETAGSVFVTVVMGNVATNATAVTVSTADGTAHAGHDYTAVNTQLTWANGSTGTRTVAIPILNSGDTSATPRTFAIALSGATGGASVVGANPVAVSIAMTPPPPPPPPPTVSAGTISFIAPSFATGETNVSVMILVKRTGATNQAASVTYSTSNGSAVAGVDYTATSGTLSWSANDNSSKPFWVLISNTGTIGPPRSFKVSLSNPTNGANLGLSSALVSIAMNATVVVTLPVTIQGPVTVSGSVTIKSQ